MKVFRVTISQDPVADVLNNAIALTERGQYAKALNIFVSVYKTIVVPDEYPHGMSSYGLCLALVEQKIKLGAELCERAMILQPHDALHRANLVRIYAAANNRRKAVAILERRPLTRTPREMGYRSAPSMRSLRRPRPLDKIAAVLSPLRLG